MIIMAIGHCPVDSVIPIRGAVVSAENTVFLLSNPTHGGAIIEGGCAIYLAVNIFLTIIGGF
jgi:hypothetical protein